MIMAPKWKEAGIVTVIAGVLYGVMRGLAELVLRKK
jgi:hypothetical protein